MERKYSKSRESDKLLKHELGNFKDTLFCMCLVGSMVTSLSLICAIAGLNNHFNYK